MRDVHLGVLAVVVGMAPLGAAGCSVLLSDPGGYYLADAAASSHVPVPEAAEAASEVTTALPDGDDSAEEAQDDTGSVSDGPIEVATTDGPTCHSTQIVQPVNLATVTSPVHLVTTWDPCMTAVDCYLDGQANAPIATATSAPGVVADIPVSPGSHFFACTTFWPPASALPSPTVTFVVVGDGGAEQ